MPIKTTKTTKPKKVSSVGQRAFFAPENTSENNGYYPQIDNNTTYNPWVADNTTYSTESYSCNGDCANCQIACPWNKNISFTWVDDKTNSFKTNPLNEPMEINEYIKRFKDKPTKKNKEKLKSIIEEENNLKKQKQEIQKQEKELINKTKMLEKKEKELNTKEEKLKKEQDSIKKEKEETQNLKKELYQNKELADILKI